jgi:hypothetical protein
METPSVTHSRLFPPWRGVPVTGCHTVAISSSSHMYIPVKRMYRSLKQSHCELPAKTK